jgi:hypothetical protein
MDFDEGKMMKNAEEVKYSALCSWSFAFLSVALVFWVAGCGYVRKGGSAVGRKTAVIWTAGSDPEAYAQLGETEAEGRRRHIRNKRINRQQLITDIDTVLLLDKPSKLSDKRMP